MILEVYGVKYEPHFFALCFSLMTQKPFDPISRDKLVNYLAEGRVFAPLAQEPLRHAETQHAIVIGENRIGRHEPRPPSPDAEHVPELQRGVVRFVVGRDYPPLQSIDGPGPWGEKRTT